MFDFMQQTTQQLKLLSVHNPLHSLVPAAPAPVVYAVFDVNRALQIIETTWNKVRMLFSTLLTRKLLKLKYANM